MHEVDNSIYNRTKLVQQLTYLHHFSELLQIAGDEVQEGEFVKVLSSLVSHLNDLVIALQQSRFTEAFPAVLVIQRSSCLQRNLQNIANVLSSQTLHSTECKICHRVIITTHHITHTPWSLNSYCAC